jgi:hypothetical protein
MPSIRRTTERSAEDAHGVVGDSAARIPAPTRSTREPGRSAPAPPRCSMPSKKRRPRETRPSITRTGAQGPRVHYPEGVAGRQHARHHATLGPSSAARGGRGSALEPARGDQRVGERERRRSRWRSRASSGRTERNDSTDPSALVCGGEAQTVRPRESTDRIAQDCLAERWQLTSRPHCALRSRSAQPRAIAAPSLGGTSRSEPSRGGRRASTARQSK